MPKAEPVSAPGEARTGAAVRLVGAVSAPHADRRHGYEVRRDAARGGIGDGADVDVISTEVVEERLRSRGLAPHWHGRPPGVFEQLVLDSRAARPGGLFCAIAGARHDGHRFVGAAAQSGAAAAVVERRLSAADLDPDFPLLQVSDTREAAAHLASLFYGDPGERLRLVGVTGTNGKTTTVWLLRYLLEELGPAAALGTLGAQGPEGELHPGVLTTPDPLRLATDLSTLRDAGAESIAVEVSSHALDQRRADAVRFRAVVYTNLSREHLDYHGDMRHYLEAKLRLLELVDLDGACVVNAGEPAWAAVQERARAAGIRVITYASGIAEPREVAASSADRHAEPSATVEAGVRATEIRHEEGGSRWRLETPVGGAEVSLPLPGEFNVDNALAAAAVALDLGLDPLTIAARLASVPAVPGRMEILRRRPSLVLRDYAHTPDSFERVLTALRARTVGRLIAVFGCGGDRDPGKRPVMGRIASQYCDLTLLTTDNPRSEDPAEIAQETAAEMDPGRYEIVLDRETAIVRALDEARSDDVVVLLGKGHETYQMIGEQKLPFDERAIVTRLTAERSGEAQ